MTAAAKLKRLTAGTHWKVERIDRGIDSLPPELLAGALPSDALQQSIIMAKYMLTNRREAYNYCRNEFSHVIRKYKWDIPKGIEIYRAICRLAVDEVVDEPLCPRCNGREEIWIKGQNIPVTCNLCEGSGHRAKTEGQRYRLVKAMPYSGLHEVSEDDWHNKWKHRSYEAFRLAMEAHNEGVRHMIKQLEEF